MTCIDAHQHFWHPARGDYGWMPADNEILCRPYSPADLDGARKSVGVEQTILVQAAPSVHETEYMLGIADSNPHIGKVVGWVDFNDPSQIDTLKRLAGHPKFSGVRPMIQDLPDDNWMHLPEVQWAYQAIVDLDLTFDCLGFVRHAEGFHTLLTRYPKMRAVIDHCLKPQLRDHSDEAFHEWAAGISKLAEDTNAFCKLSGLLTEADEDWSNGVIKPYTDHVISAFGAQRVMWGSDWPVLRLRTEYENWLEQAKQLTAHLSEEDRQWVFNRSARAFYQLT